MYAPDSNPSIRRTSDGAIDLEFYKTRARKLRAQHAGRTVGRLIASLTERTDKALKVLGTISAAYVTPRA